MSGVAVGRDVSEQSGKAGLVGHGCRLREGSARRSFTLNSFLLPTREKVAEVI